MSCTLHVSKRLVTLRAAGIHVVIHKQHVMYSLLRMKYTCTFIILMNLYCKCTVYIVKGHFLTLPDDESTISLMAFNFVPRLPC